jgi:hypothetical protein
MIQFKNGGVHVSTKMKRIHKSRIILDRDGFYFNGGGLLICRSNGVLLISFKNIGEIEIFNGGFCQLRDKSTYGWNDMVDLPFPKLWRLVCGPCS